MSDNDTYLMRQAMSVAAGNPQAPFAAVLAVGREIVATGLNRCRIDGPIWHGEMDCLNNAAADGFDDWRSATLATTAEPCPMCMSAILWAGVGHVAYGTSVPTLAERGWSQFKLRAIDIIAAQTFSRCSLAPDVLAADCDRLFTWR